MIPKIKSPLCGALLINTDNLIEGNTLDFGNKYGQPLEKDETSCNNCNSDEELKDEHIKSRICTKCGRKLDNDEIVCRNCFSKERNIFNGQSHEEKSYSNKVESMNNQSHGNGFLRFIGVLSILFVIYLFLNRTGIFGLIFQPYLILGSGEDKVYIPIEVVNSTDWEDKTVEKSDHTVRKDEDFLFSFGTYSGYVKNNLSGLCVTEWDDCTLSRSTDNIPNNFMIENYFGNCIVVTNYGSDFGYDEMYYKGYTISNITYEFLYPVKDNKINESSDNLSTIVYELNIINASAVYEDLILTLSEKYGDYSSSLSTENEKCTTWNFSDDTNLSLYCRYDPEQAEVKDYYEEVLISYYIDGINEKKDIIEAIRQQEALAAENAIRENRT